MKFLGTISLILILPLLSGHAQTQQELEERLQKRYEDFYTRLNDKNTRPYETKAARAAQKKERAQELAQREASRKAYARKQKVQPSEDLHLKEIEERERQHEQARKAYVQRQKRLEAARERLEVPEWVEYELYDDTLVSDSPAKSSN